MLIGHAHLALCRAPGSKGSGMTGISACRRTPTAHPGLWILRPRAIAAQVQAGLCQPSPQATMWRWQQCLSMRLRSGPQTLLALHHLREGFFLAYCPLCCRQSRKYDSENKMFQGFQVASPEPSSSPTAREWGFAGCKLWLMLAVSHGSECRSAGGSCQGYSPYRETSVASKS